MAKQLSRSLGGFALIEYPNKFRFPLGAWHRQGTAGCTASKFAGRSRTGWSVVSWNSHVGVIYLTFFPNISVFSPPFFWNDHCTYGKYEPM